MPLTTWSAEVYSESAVKAAYLYRFVDYIEWPEAAPTNQPFVIAVFNDDDVSNELIRLLGNRSLKAAPARVKKIADLREAATAQVLYLGAIKADDLHTLTEALANRPILVVTSIGNVEFGGIINFIHVDNRIRFEVSLSAAEKAGLKIDAGLLAVANKVYGGRPRLETCQPGASPNGDSGCTAYSGAP